VVDYILNYPIEVTSITQLVFIGSNTLAFLSNCGIFYLLNLSKRVISLHYRNAAYSTFDIDIQGKKMALVGIDGLTYVYKIKNAVRQQKSCIKEKLELGIEPELLETMLSEVHSSMS